MVQEYAAARVVGRYPGVHGGLDRATGLLRRRRRLQESVLAPESRRRRPGANHLLLLRSPPPAAASTPLGLPAGVTHLRAMRALAAARYLCKSTNTRLHHAAVSRCSSSYSREGGCDSS